MFELCSFVVWTTPEPWTVVIQVQVHRTTLDFHRTTLVLRYKSLSYFSAIFQAIDSDIYNCNIYIYIGNACTIKIMQCFNYVVLLLKQHLNHEQWLIQVHRTTLDFHRTTLDFHRTTLVLRYKGLGYFFGFRLFGSSAAVHCFLFYFLFYLSYYFFFFNLFNFFKFEAGYSEAIPSVFCLGSW